MEKLARKLKTIWIHGKQLSESHKNSISEWMVNFYNNKWRSWSIWKNWYRHVVIWWVRTYEHRINMENKLWRKLKRNEHVHHIDWNKLNNNIENLQLYSAWEHLREHAIENWLWKDRLWISPKNKLCTDIVDKIKDMYQNWVKRYEIAKIMWMSPTTIYKYTTN